MLFSSLAVAALAAGANAAALCRPTSTKSAVVVTPTLPAAGAATELVTPPSPLTLKKIAVGHGIQNYTCANTSATATQLGALAVLYDVTAYYPGTPGTGLSAAAWASLPSTVLWNSNIPLNLVNAAAASPGTVAKPNALPESAYLANTAQPFPPAADLVFSTAVGLPSFKFLGHHFFDATSTPNFDLSAAGLFGNVAKNSSVAAPSTADTGIIGSGAVPWLRLNDTKGLSNGVSEVYRVITAGGTAQSCATAGAGLGSVPYTAFYWFFG